MKIVVIDGQGGSIGRAILERLVQAGFKENLVCIGTNSVATSNMMKSGVVCGAIGENPVVVASRDADYIIGPIGIMMADAMLGEITPTIAQAIGASAAHKILIPVGKCVTVTGVQELSLTDYIELAIRKIDN